MSVIQIAELRRDRTFQSVAQAAVEEDIAVGSPDETGWPRIRASIRRVTACAGCGLRLPEDHRCTRQETSL